MTKETRNMLTTGDVITNASTNQTQMVSVIDSPQQNIISVDTIRDIFQHWELSQSRNYTSPEHLRRIQEYHEKIKEQMDIARKG